MMYFTTAGLRPAHEMVEELRGCYLHHSAWREGYVPVKAKGCIDYGEPLVEAYSGRFGEGYKVHFPYFVGKKQKISYSLLLYQRGGLNMGIAIGLFDFNNYLVRRSEVAQDLFEVLSEAGEPVDTAKEERDGFLTSTIHPFRSYLLQ